MPIAQRGESRGQAHSYDTAAVVAWLVERTRRKANAEDPKAELYRTQVQLNRMKIAEAERQLVNAGEAEAEFSRLVIDARQQLLQIPATLAMQLEAVERGSWAAAIERAIRGALQAIVERAGSKDSAGGVE